MKTRRFLRDGAGTAAVEFATLAPVFFAMAFGVVDAGCLVWTQMSIEHAVESAARCASLGSTNCTSATEVQSYAASQAPGLGISPTAFTYATPTCGSQVAATYNYYYLSSAFPNRYSKLTARSCVPLPPT